MVGDRKRKDGGDLLINYPLRARLGASSLLLRNTKSRAIFLPCLACLYVLYDSKRIQFLGCPSLKCFLCISSSYKKRSESASSASSCQPLSTDAHPSRSLALICGP